MNVVLVSSEAVPFSKTGGLADVAGALPAALDRQGVRATLIVPCHRSSWRAGESLAATGVRLRVPVGPRWVEATAFESRLPNSDVPVYLLDAPQYFDRPALYGENGADYHDNCERFVFFSRAAIELIRALDLRVDVVHCNDWQTGLIPAYIDEFERTRPGSPLSATGTLFTIHNMAYQGSFWHLDMPLTGLDWRLFNMHQLEAYGRLNFLKAGLVYSDVLSTVSPTYAEEIQTEEFGWGLDALLRSRSGDLRGIVNGIDPTEWHPSVDRHIAQHFDLENWAEGKALCKAQLQRRADFAERPDVPLLAVVSRLDPQKGWDLIFEVIAPILERDVQVVVLGTGSPAYQERLSNLAADHAGKLRAFLEFSNPLAHQIEAGADLFLMPSIYEPCGLNQLYSLAYGTVPIVRRTGGLADTVVDATADTLAAGTANGFAFGPATGSALLGAVDRALAAYHDRGLWNRLVHAAMRADWTWDRSARSYLELYREIAARRRSRAAG